MTLPSQRMNVPCRGFASLMRFSVSTDLIEVGRIPDYRFLCQYYVSKPPKKAITEKNANLTRSNEQDIDFTRFMSIGLADPERNTTSLAKSGNQRVAGSSPAGGATSSSQGEPFPKCVTLDKAVHPA